MLKSMLQHLRDARAEELEGEGAAEAGFTLIELMVVLLIIAILLAIAIPTFLGVTKSANDRAAQSNLTNAVTEAAAIYQNNNQAYPDQTAANWPNAGGPTGLSYYNTAAPEFTWQNGAAAAGKSTAQNQMAVDSFAVAGEANTAYQGVAIAVLSPSTQTCWFVVNLQGTPAAGGTYTTAGTYYAKSTPANCYGGYAAAHEATGSSYGQANTI